MTKIINSIQQNKRRNGFLSSTISSVQRSFNRTLETDSLTKVPAYPVLLSSRSALKSSITSPEDGTLSVKPKSPSPQRNRLTLSQDSINNNQSPNVNTSLFEISAAVATMKKTPTNCSAKKVVKQEKELRKKAQEVAILMENRLSRLKDIEREYQKKIDEAGKQANSIQSNKERHFDELKKKREQHKEKKKEIKEKQEFFNQVQNEMKQKIMESKLKALEEKKKSVIEMKKKKENLMKEAKKMKNYELRRKKENIKRIEMDKLIAKEMRVQDVIKKIQQNVEELSNETEYEKAIKLLISEQAINIEDAEVQMLEKLKKLEVSFFILSIFFDIS